VNVLDDICADIETRLKPTGLTFAVVVWFPGKAASPASIGVSAPPQHQAETATALTTAIAALAGGRPMTPITIRADTPRETVEDHDWFSRFGLVVCKRCGLVQRADGKNRPCPGPVRVALRSATIEPKEQA